ncbi:MAG TPA: hypothetical protein VJO35_02555 [Terriglobales bacterium]|nr:hypothetical protein [Terriglobales bacterium]
MTARTVFVTSFSALLLSLCPSMLNAQTATCTNWKFFSMPSPWIRTLPSGINRWYTVVGETYDPSQNFDGFIRYSDGSIKLYSAPNSSSTSLTGRNAQGVSVGTYNDKTSAHHYHGIVIYSSSTATVNFPGASDTFLTKINQWGTIVGNYYDAAKNNHGFELKNNKFTEIDYPGALSTHVSSISDKAVIVGWYQKSGSPHDYGFVLQNGQYQTLEDAKGTGNGTDLRDINSSGTIVGVYWPNSVPRGFVYTNGEFKDIAPSDANYTLTVSGINGYGYVTGETSQFGSSGYTAHCQ